MFGNLEYINNKDKIVRFWKSKPYKPGLFQKGWVPAHPTFYCKREIFVKFGNFDTSYWISADFDLMMRFIEINQINSKYINKKLVKMRTGGNSNGSLRIYLESHRQILSIFKKNTVRVNSIKFSWYKIKRFLQFINRN